MKITYTKKETVKIQETIEGKAFRIISGDTTETIEMYIVGLSPDRYLHIKPGDPDGSWASLQITNFLPDMDSIFRKRIEPCHEHDAYDAYYTTLHRIEAARERGNNNGKETLSDEDEHDD